MKSKSYKKAVIYILLEISKNAGDWGALKGIVVSVYRKVISLLYQKISISLFRIFHYQRYQQAKQPIYIVYTMAKVGSSSIYNTLRLKIPYSSLSHVYFLTKEGLFKRERFYKDVSITQHDREL